MSLSKLNSVVYSLTLIAFYTIETINLIFTTEIITDSDVCFL